MTESIPQGYKQTEIGIIPEDWEEATIESLSKTFTKQTGFDYSAYIKPKLISIFREGTLPFIQNKDFHAQETNFDTDYFIPEEVANNFPRILLNERCLLISISGKIGNVGVFSNFKKAFIGGAVAVIKFKDKKKLDWVMYYLLSPRGQHNLFNQVKAGSHQNLILADIREIKIPIPSEEEQKIIVNSLSDLDKILKKLDKLITKKKDIKKGAMQELLTGKKRLPGFTGEWEDCLFSDILELNKGQQLNRSSLTEKGEYPAWNGGIEPSGYTDKCNAKANTITISEGGNSCGFVNYCITDFWCGGHCYALRILNSSTNKSYLYNLLKFKEPQIMSLRIGSGLPNIQKKNLYEFELKLPKEPEEQSAIASILSDMDSEIEELEQKRNKYRMIKEGMMQQLLTGRIRLKWK